MPQKTEHTMKTALLGGKKGKYFFPICVAVQNSILCTGSCTPSTNNMAPAALFPSENIYILVTSVVTLEINFDERREKADGLEKDPNSYSLLRKSQV